jgi:hypothetical protein
MAAGIVVERRSDPSSRSLDAVDDVARTAAISLNQPPPLLRITAFDLKPVLGPRRLVARDKVRQGGENQSEEGRVDHAPVFRTTALETDGAMPRSARRSARSRAASGDGSLS